MALRLSRSGDPKAAGVDEPSTWHAGRSIRIARLSVSIVAVALLGWLVWWVLAVVGVKPWSSWTGVERRCGQFSGSCGVATGIIVSGVWVAGGFAYLLLRLRRVERWYRRRAQARPQDLVPTAGPDIDQVVGRNQLCTVVMDDLHDHRRYRPHVLVGGVGTGKTAVLVKLTQMLAEKGAIPVAIRLRDAVHDLDFEQLARERFAGEIDRVLFSPGEGEWIWRRLRVDRKIVVLADGLEEAFVGSEAEPERNNLIRVAIQKAHDTRLPLVIASRPHDPLRGTEAAILELEPLSDEAALSYIESGEATDEEQRLDWIVETAHVVESPLYLHLTRDLNRHGLLQRTSMDQNDTLDTRGRDRSMLRLELLRTWENALVHGHLHKDVALSPLQRRATIERLSALACVGLKLDRLDVDFKMSLSEDTELGGRLKERLEEIEQGADEEQQLSLRNIDAQIAATWGTRLGLVEPLGNGVRFPHSLIQAYLGSRLIGSALLDDSYSSCAFTGVASGREALGPGREFLIALVLYSRDCHDRARRPSTGKPHPAGSVAVPVHIASPDGTDGAEVGPDQICAQLLTEAAKRSDNKALDMYAAALEIDCVATRPVHGDIGKRIQKTWRQIQASDPQTLEEAKLGLVGRFGEALRAIEERRRRAGTLNAEPAYRQLYEIGCQEPSYPIRHAIAQEIGAGGDAAYLALATLLTPPLAAPERYGDSADANHAWRARIMNAWLAPLLLGHAGPRDEDCTGAHAVESARQHLIDWVRLVQPDQWQASSGHLPLSEEVALAQGFKWAANRRPPHPLADQDTRTFLHDQAQEMLRGARSWFSQLTLIHALCLWSLSDGSKRHEPDATVDHWLDIANSRRVGPEQAETRLAIHSFVQEAAELTKRALATGRPERYCWIDESGVVARVGSHDNVSGTVHRNHYLWIAPSTGWSTLDDRAQRLVADVLLFLNLAERGDRPDERERRLEHANQSSLPPCLSSDRRPLDPGRTVGMADTFDPGTGCADGCFFELCPYPPKGAQPAVAELTEAFCRRQQSLLLRSSRLDRAPWQRTSREGLREFWAQMADRASGSHLRSGLTEPS